MNITKFTVILFYLSLFLKSGLLSQEPVYHFENIAKEDGLSNNRVYSIYQDNKGFLWIGTLDGLNRFDGYDFTIFKNQPGDPSTIANNRSTIIYQDKLGYIWIAGKNTGLSWYNPETQKFKNYEHIKHNPTSLPENDISEIYESEEDNRLIIRTKNKHCTFNRKDETFTEIKPVPNPNAYHIPRDILKQLKRHLKGEIWMVTEFIDSKGNIWISSRGHGLVRVNHDGTITRFSNSMIYGNKINAIFEDKYGIIWLGSEDEGLFKYNPESEKFALYRTFSNDSVTVGSIQIRAITKDFSGNIWIGTAKKGVVKFDAAERKFRHFKHSDNTPHSLPHNKVRTIFTDKDGDVWAGTYKGLSRYNASVNGFDNYSLVDKGPQAADSSEYRVYNITEDKFGNLWIANWESLVKFNKADSSYVTFPKQLFGLDNIRLVFIDGKNILWLGAEFGGMAQFDLKNEEYIESVQKYNEQLSNENVFDIHEDKYGNIWVATFNGLNFIDKKTKQISHFTTKDGLSGNMIYGILEDKQSHLWLTSTNGLSRMGINDKKIINFNVEHGLQSNEFTEGAFYADKINNTFIVGGTDGLNIFCPDSIEESSVLPDIVFTNLKILNKTVRPNEEINKRVLITSSIEYNQKLRFNRLDKIITFEFAALHYKSPGKNRYEYKMEGFDDEWIPTDASRRYATYTNLNPGNYIFRVRATNCDGKLNEEGAAIEIKIIPPFWRTIWFYILVLVAISSGVYYYIKQREKQAEARNQFLEKKVKEGEKTINQKIEEVNRQHEEIKRRDEEEKEIRYFNTGLAKFGEIISNNNDDIDNLCKSVIAEVIEYVNVEQVVIYLKETDADGNDYLIQRGEYVGDNEETKKKFYLGEGMPGACLQDGKIMQVDNLPENYAQFGSFLGQASLKHLVALPIAINELKAGVIELLSFRKVPDFKVDFMRKLSENLTSTIEYIKSNKEVEKLLEESKVKTESLAAQEEELRQNLEEMTAIQETSAAEKEKMEKAISELQNSNQNIHKKLSDQELLFEAFQSMVNSLDTPICVRDKNKKIILCNSFFVEKIGYTSSEEVISGNGTTLKSYSDILSLKKNINVTNYNGDVIGIIEMFHR